jgi:hypothetical protein
MKQDRGVLEGNLAPVLQHLSTNRIAVQTIQQNLAMNKILPGDTQKYINEPNTLYKIEDSRVLYLLTESVYRFTKNESINPEEYFYKNEIDTAKRYDENIFRKKDIFPFTLDDIVSRDGEFGGFISVQDINTLFNERKINYNFDLQREPTKVKRYNDVMLVPTLNMQNVNDITESLLKGQQYKTTIVLNAALGTSKSGQEIIYNDDKKTITFTKGTVLDIVDGYHRCKAVQNALIKNPNLQFYFQILVLNTDTAGARRYQGQFAKGTPLSEDRKRALNQPGLEDKVVDSLNTNSDLAGKISQQKDLNDDDLVMYSDLASAIKDNFELKVTNDAKKVSQYLIDFFNSLIGKFPEELHEKIMESKNNSYVGLRQMFSGYIILASRMYKQNIPADMVELILDQINFNKNNPLWKNIVIGQGRNKETVSNIKDLFNNFNID